jgi:predicted nucleic acid-binding Zn ribbon protein
LLRTQAKRVKANLRQCTVCGRTFEPRQSNAVTCSSACRQKAYRQRKRTIAAGQSPT